MVGSCTQAESAHEQMTVVGRGSCTGVHSCGEGALCAVRLWPTLLAQGVVDLYIIRRCCSCIYRNCGGVPQSAVSVDCDGLDVSQLYGFINPRVKPLSQLISLCSTFEITVPPRVFPTVPMVPNAFI